MEPASVWTMLYRSLFLLMVAAMVRAQSMVTILSKRSFTYIEPRSEFQILCQVQELAGKAVQWNHNGKLIATVAQGNTIVHMDPGDAGKYTFIGAEREGGNFSMTINSFYADDVGSVKCVVENAEAVHYLRLLKPPDEVRLLVESVGSVYEFHENLPVVHALENSWVNLTCISVRTVPEPNFQWFWNDSNSFLDMNRTKNTLSEANGVFNGTSSLHLPPGFLTDLWQSYAVNLTESFASAMSPQNDSAMIDASPTLKQVYVSAESMLKPVVRLTCVAAVEDRRYSKHLLLRVGPLRSSASFVRPFATLLFVLHLLFSAGFL